MRSFNLVFLAGAQKSTKLKVADVTLHEYRELRMYLKNIAKFFTVNSIYATIKTQHDTSKETGEFRYIAEIKTFLIKLLTSMLKSFRPHLIEPQIRL